MRGTRGIPALFLSIFLLTKVATLPSLQKKHWKSSPSVLIEDILQNHIPHCEIILLQDEYFSSHMNAWLVHFSYPYYSLTLDGKPFPDYTTWKDVTKTAGFTCSTVIAACLRFSSCRNNDSKVLFTMLRANGIILREKRALMYIHEDGDFHRLHFENGSIPPHYGINLLSYQEQDGKRYSLSALNLAKIVLRELRSHITLIRTIPVAKDAYVNSTPLQEFENDGEFYETLTFSPNWLPGGTPVMRNIWSARAGFSFRVPLQLSIHLLRGGGKVRICTSGMEILPLLSVKPNQGIRGLDGDMIKIFQRRFKLSVDIFEPKDKDYGRRRKSGNWTGVIGYVIRRDSDIGIGQITFSFDRFASGLKFSPTLAILSAVAICPQPALLPRINALVQPYDKYAWLYLGLSAIVVIVVIQVMQVIALQSIRIPLGVSRREMVVSWLEVAGPILRTGTLRNLPRRWAILALTGVWLLVALVITASYTCVLIGALSFPPRKPYVTSPYDLVRRDMPFGIAAIVQQAIENSILQDEREMYWRAEWTQERTANGTAPEAKVYTYVDETGNCAIVEKLRAKYVLGRERQASESDHSRRPYISRDSIFIGPTGWALRSDMDFILENYFDKAFTLFHSYGLFAKTMKDFNNQSFNPLDHGVTQSGFQAIKLKTIMPLFFCAACCHLLSFLIFCCELAIYKLKQRQSAFHNVIISPSVPCHSFKGDKIGKLMKSHDGEFLI